jgi:hypothetical protein
MEQKSCLKTVCQYNNTKDECNEYDRCVWDTSNTKCKTKENLCEDLSSTQCQKNDSCDWKPEIGKCLWKQNRNKLNLEDRTYAKCGNPKFNMSCDAEEYGLNKMKCFKEKNTKQNVIKKQDNETEKCFKHRCLSKDGFKMENNKCVKFFDPIEQVTQKTQPRTVNDHDHENSNDYIKSNLFVVKKDNSSLMILKGFLLFIIILANVGFMKLKITKQISYLFKRIFGRY